MNAYLRLQAAKGVGPAAQRKILAYVADRNMMLEEFLRLPTATQKEAGLREDQIVGLQNADPQDWQRNIDAKAIQIVGWLDEMYPKRLRRVLADQAPPVLYAWGDLSLLRIPAVGFCGARNASHQGIAAAVMIAGQVASANWVVVSGQARGVDTSAHVAALKQGGSTIIVAPEGIFSLRLRAEVRALVDSGNTLVISEFQPDARWSVANAMTRNRTIAGLSDALVVVESGTSGGTFQAGKFALSVSVPLFAVEYTDPAPSAAGNPYFVQRGAYPLRQDRATGSVDLTHLFDEVEMHHELLQKPKQAIPVQASLFE